MVSVSPSDVAVGQASSLPVFIEGNADGAPAPLWRAEYPFESHYLDLGGVRMHYVDESSQFADRGLQTANRALLLLHGNPTWSFLFRHVISEFRGSMRVIAPDHIGCGLSDSPQDYSYRLDQHIANIERLVDHLGLKQINLGVHDWGGAIGFGLATRRPDLIKRLVVFNTAAFASKRIPLSVNVCRIPGFGALAIRGFNGFLRGALMRCAKRPLSAAAKAGYLAPYPTWARRVAHLRFVQDIPLRPSHPSWKTLKDIEAGLPKLAGKPMLICWGGKDFCFNDSFLEGWKKRFPAANVHRFADAGHFVLEDARDEISMLLHKHMEVA
ncbi:MAG: alpha/beta fold hydrolase [Planctomycetes bacterium]|nr:alpha/beta fold hydrolase [Planctomycetota bacterium]